MAAVTVDPRDVPAVMQAVRFQCYRENIYGALEILDAAQAKHPDPRYATETARIPVLMLSARSQDTDVELAHTVGADDYVTKPFKGADLIQRVRWLLLSAC